MIYRPILAAMIAAATLVGCDGADAGGKPGTVEINAPGFELKTDRLGGLLADSDFDIDGVKLYPGSTTTAVRIDAAERAADRNTVVRIEFASPAPADKTRAWFVEQFRKAGRPAAAAGGAVAGTTKDGKPVRIELVPAGEGCSGVVTIASA